MTPFRENPKFKWGEEFERALSVYLQSRGWGVLPVYDYSGDEDKAPKMHRVGGGLVLPDLFAARRGTSCWVEAKRKTRTDLHRITNTVETGIPLRLYRQYEQVRDESGIDVWLFFGHEREDEVRCLKVGEIEPRIYAGSVMSRGGMAFFPWERLHFLCKLTDVILQEVAA